MTNNTTPLSERQDATSAQLDVMLANLNQLGHEQAYLHALLIEFKRGQAIPPSEMHEACALYLDGLEKIVLARLKLLQYAPEA